MPSEARRACGFRKVGGLYLCADGAGIPCCRLPIPLTVCPACNAGVKQTRGWSWVDPRPWLQRECRLAPQPCIAANPESLGERVGLLWIGEQFYPTPAHFQFEAQKMGISRRIKAIPRGFEIGKHWVFLAHPKGCSDTIAGIFRIMKPDRVEKIVTHSEAQDVEAMKKLTDAGITPVSVSDNDKAHQGSVYDDDDVRETLI